MQVCQSVRWAIAKGKKKTNIRYASKRNDVLWNVISIARVIDQTRCPRTPITDIDARQSVSASDIHPRRMRLAASLYFFPPPSPGRNNNFFFLQRCRNAEAASSVMVTSSAGHGNEYLCELVHRGAKCSHLVVAARCNNTILKKGVRIAKLVFILTYSKTKKGGRRGKRPLEIVASHVCRVSSPADKSAAWEEEAEMRNHRWCIAIAMTSLKITPRNPSHCSAGLFSGDRVSRMTHS